jgi:DNA-binding NtrC family response regulator
MTYHVLCIDDEADYLFSIKKILKKEFQVSTALSIEKALDVLKMGDVDVILLDLELGAFNGLSALDLFKKNYPLVEILMLSGHKNPKEIVESIKKGASDYVTKGEFPDEILAAIHKAIKNKDLKDRYAALIENYNTPALNQKLVGEAESFLGVLDQAQRLIGFDANVLIEGESGTGKDLLARYLHQIERNKRRPFIMLNCAAIPENLVESELFGHEKGSFSGAVQRSIGKFELANDGDIFLDEIQALKPTLQAKLLTILQSKEFYRLGGNTAIRVNFRVIAASNTCLEKLVEKGEFREDLFHRLKVISLRMPPLRARQKDIPLFVSYFSKKFSKDNENRKKFSKEALDVLLDYSWPGNVRELENVIRSLTIMCDKEVVDMSDLPSHILYSKGSRKDHQDGPLNLYFRLPTVKLNRFLQEAEHKYAKTVLEANSGNKSATAKVLGVSRQKVHKIFKSKPLLGNYNA